MKEWGWLCQKGGSLHQVPKRSLCLGPAVRGSQPCLLAGISWAPTKCMEYNRFFMQRRLHASLFFFAKLYLFERETNDDFVFFLDKESKIWNGIMRKKYICVCFHADRNSVVYKHRGLWVGLMLWSTECLSPSICALFSHWFSAAHLVGYGMNANGERHKKSEQVSSQLLSGNSLGDLLRSKALSPFKTTEFPIPHCVIIRSPKEWTESTRKRNFLSLWMQTPLDMSLLRNTSFLPLVQNQVKD